MPRGRKKKAEDVQNVAPEAEEHELTEQEHEALHGCFDFVCSRNLVWNLEAPERAYSEWLRVLKSGGRLLVCDGNHYLHYYNKEYQRVWEERLPHDTRGVDPAPINEIARGLPLSRQLRPEWDVDTLANMGLKEIHVRRLEEPLTMNFILWGTK